MARPIQWSEDLMNSMFLDIFEHLKGPNITQKKLALDNITQYILQINVVSTSAEDSLFQTHLTEVVEEILDIHENFKELALEASKFWYNYLDNHWPLEEQFLSRIMQVLLVNLSYVEDDIALCNVELLEVDNSYPYEEVSIFWTLREYSASILKKLAYTFSSNIIPPLMEFIKKNVMDTNVAVWKKESAILSLGLISEHCMNALGPHLSELAPWMPLIHLIPLVKKTTMWAILQCREVYIKVCPMVQGIHLRDENPAIEFIPSTYFTDWAEAGFAPHCYNQRDDKMVLARHFDHVPPHAVTKHLEFIVLKLIWESQTPEQSMPDAWMFNFARFLERRLNLNVAPPPVLKAGNYVELNPTFSEDLPIYYQPLPHSATGILEKSEKEELIPSLAKEGAKRVEFLRLCRRVTMGLHILGICGNRLLDDVSITKFFLPYEFEEERGLDPTAIDTCRKRVFNHIHKVPPQELWGFEVIRYKYKVADKFYFQLNY